MFWKSLAQQHTPFFVLAPMEEVTDTVFRRLIAGIGKPDVFFTEFMSVEGFMSRGREKVSYRLEHTDTEKPLIAQIWGLSPEKFYQTAKEIREMGFVGIDLNMGCPKEDVVKRGACAGLIQLPKLAGEIIQATQEGAGDLPVSVKTRIGHKSETINEWISHVLSYKPAALTIHFRTVEEMSKVPAHWDLAPKVVALRDEISPETVIIGNGDVLSRSQGEELAKTYSLDGIMIGRGIFHNPWVFAKEQVSHSMQEKLNLLLLHARTYTEYWGKRKNYHVLKRFYKIYATDFDGAAELREQLMPTNSLEEAEAIIAKFLVKNQS
ncbi:MAG: tRNA-dihydrouridine synthase [Candidatus Dojkabacteria bacterium]|nr:MAG: tRNA-dihydrouridine synthase [Candidatus Dojkabacteria bacterium]